MFDVHAIADDWHRAHEWRKGGMKVTSWSVRDVATGFKLGAVILDEKGSYNATALDGASSSHSQLSQAVCAIGTAMGSFHVVH